LIENMGGGAFLIFFGAGRGARGSGWAEDLPVCREEKSRDASHLRGTPPPPP